MISDVFGGVFDLPVSTLLLLQIPKKIQYENCEHKQHDQCEHHRMGVHGDYGAGVHKFLWNFRWNL